MSDQQDQGQQQDQQQQQGVQVDLPRVQWAADLLTREGLSMFESVITAGQSALKALLFVNGGSSVAMLAFIGHLFSQGIKTKHDVILATGSVDSLKAFVLGVLLALTATALTYINQLVFSLEAEKNRKIVFNNLSNLQNKPLREYWYGRCVQGFIILIGTSSIACFLYGAYLASCTFSKYIPLAFPG